MQNEDTKNDKDKEHNLSVWPLCAISNQLCFVSNGLFTGRSAQANLQM